MAIEKNIHTIVGAFKNNLKSVDELVNFDREVLEFAITSISTLKREAKKTSQVRKSPSNGSEHAQPS